jgi:hypothetical protein
MRGPELLPGERGAATKSMRAQARAGLGQHLYVPVSPGGGGKTAWRQRAGFALAPAERHSAPVRWTAAARVPCAVRSRGVYASDWCQQFSPHGLVISALCVDSSAAYGPLRGSALRGGARAGGRRRAPACERALAVAHGAQQPRHLRGSGTHHLTAKPPAPSAPLAEGER